jgi:hypothetical protein
MGKLLAKRKRTSLGRVLQEMKQFVDPIEEVQFNVTSNGVKIANSDESFFGETL